MPAEMTVAAEVIAFLLHVAPPAPATRGTASTPQGERPMIYTPD